MDKDYQDDKDFDMTGATRGIPPQIARRQAKHKTEQEPSAQGEFSLIEPDVWQLIRQNADKASQIAKVNGVLRLMLS